MSASQYVSQTIVMLSHTSSVWKNIIEMQDIIYIYIYIYIYIEVIFKILIKGGCFVWMLCFIVVRSKGSITQKNGKGQAQLVE